MECGTLTALLRGQTMARHGVQPKSTTRGITSVARGTGATALPLAVAVVEGGGAPGDHGAPALSPVEEARGAVQGAALVEVVRFPNPLSSQLENLTRGSPTGDNVTFSLPFLAALAALYLPLVVTYSLTDCHLSISFNWSKLL